MKLRKVLSLLMLFTLSVVLFACGGNVAGPSNPGVNEVILTFTSNGGSNVSAVKKNKGSEVSKPVDPIKPDSVFDGWFKENSFTTPVSWPIVLNEGLTVYAKWTETRDHFLAARDATVNASQFEYDFNLSVNTKYGPINGPSATILGNVKYNSSSSNTFYKFQQNAGLLLPDGNIHTIKTGTELAEFKVKPDGKLYNYEKNAVKNDFKYESSSYAKVLFEYEREQITTVSLAQNGKYEVKYKGSATGIINSAIGFLDNPILQSFVNIPNSDSNLHTYVTFEDGKINTFEYDFEIVVAGATITFHYDLDFNKIGDGVTIVAPSFEGIAINSNDISAKLVTINEMFNTYRALEHSGYTYDVKTKVDFPGKNAIDARVQGRTMRYIEGSNIYFWNRIELDSDYKNNDLYKSKGIIDYERYRTVYANKDVYDVIDGVLTNTYTKTENYDNSTLDAYYFLLPTSLLNANNVSIIQESTNGSLKTYSIGLKTSGVVELLQFVDASIRLDVNEKNDIVIYDIASGLEIKGCDLDIMVDNGKLVSISIEIKGAFNSNPYVGTAFSGPSSFSLTLGIEVNDKGNSYMPPTKNSEVDLSNK